MDVDGLGKLFHAFMIALVLVFYVRAGRVKDYQQSNESGTTSD